MGPQNHRQGLNKMDFPRLHPAFLSVVLKHHRTLGNTCFFPPSHSKMHLSIVWGNFELGEGINGGEREKREGWIKSHAGTGYPLSDCQGVKKGNYSLWHYFQIITVAKKETTANQGWSAERLKVGWEACMSGDAVMYNLAHEHTGLCGLLANRTMVEVMWLTRQHRRKFSGLFFPYENLSYCTDEDQRQLGAVVHICFTVHVVLPC